MGKRIQRTGHFEDITNEVQSVVTSPGSSKGGSSCSQNYPKGSSPSIDGGVERSNNPPCHKR